MADYFMILTTWGRNAVADAIVNGTDIDITQVAVGDGTGTPTESQTALESQQYITAANTVERDADNDDWVNVELVIPPETGGWYVREVGIFAASGDLFAIGKFPETYKPTMDEGSGKELVIKAILEVSNAADVNINIDPSVVLATREYVDDQIAANSGGGGNFYYDTLLGITTETGSVGTDPAYTVFTFDPATDQYAALHLDVDADAIGMLPAGKKLKLQALCGRGAYTAGTLFELVLSGRKDNPDGSSNAISKTGQMTAADAWSTDDLLYRDTGIELTATEYGTAGCVISGKVTRNTSATGNIDALLKVLRTRWVVVDA